jgi:hypothetical protein
MTTLSVSRARVEAVGNQAGPHPTGHLARLTRAVGQWWCGAVHGHALVYDFAPDRMAQRCTDCGWQSPGWALDGRRPRIRFHGK